MAPLSYRQAIRDALHQELARDDAVVVLGEDVAAAGGVFKATAGLAEAFGPRVRDTPISEEAILGAAMGAAMVGLRPVAEIMFADFLATCWDLVANEIAKTRYMTGGQVQLPLVIRAGNGGGLRWGAQHSQSVESWAMAIPGIKVVVPSTPADAFDLLVASIRDDDPVLFLEHKALYALRAEVPDDRLPAAIGEAAVLRTGDDATVVAAGAMVHRAQAAADLLAAEGVDVAVIDLRSIVPLDLTTVLGDVRRTGRLFTVEENPRLCGWGAELVSIVAEEAFYDLDGPPVRITTPHVPLPSAAVLEDAAIPTAARIAATILRHRG